MLHVDWFWHVIWELMGVASLRRLLWVSICDLWHQIGKVSKDDASFLVHLFGLVFWELLGILSLRRFFWAPAAWNSVSRHDKNSTDHGYILYIGLNMCIVRSTESSHGDGFLSTHNLRFCRNWGKVSTEIEFVLEQWFRHVLWWLLVIVHWDGSFEYPHHVIIKVSAGNGYF